MRNQWAANNQEINKNKKSGIKNDDINNNDNI